MTSRETLGKRRVQWVRSLRTGIAPVLAAFLLAAGAVGLPACGGDAGSDAENAVDEAMEEIEDEAEDAADEMEDEY